MPTEATSSVEEEGAMCGSAGWLIVSEKSIQVWERLHNLKDNSKQNFEKWTVDPSQPRNSGKFLIIQG